MVEVIKNKRKVIETESIIDVEYRIRKKGTFTMAILNPDYNINDKSNEYYQK